MKIYIKYFLIIAIAFLACDKIEGPYRENPDELLSTVTIIEFTGIGCVNCPERGHEVVQEYKEQFGDKVQTVSIHGNEFGEPINGFYLRTTEGQVLCEELEVAGLPKGAVASLNPKAVIVPSALASDIAKVGGRLPELVLEVTMEINDTIADLTINGEFAELINENYSELYIVAYLLQNNTVGPQKDTRGDHEDYEHMHALRMPFNSILGKLYVKNPKGGTVVDKLKYSLNLNNANLILNDGENIQNLELEPFVFVYDNSNKELIPIIINYN